MIGGIGIGSLRDVMGCVIDFRPIPSRSIPLFRKIISKFFKYRVLIGSKTLRSSKAFVLKSGVKHLRLIHTGYLSCKWRYCNQAYIRKSYSLNNHIIKCQKYQKSQRHCRGLLLRLSATHVVKNCVSGDTCLGGAYNGILAVGINLRYG